MSAHPRGRFARYAVHAKCFSVREDEQRGKPKLFAPNNKGKLSVFDIDGLTRRETQNIGMHVLRQRADAKRLYGWARIDEAAIRSVGLRIIRDAAPSRHANIVDWPADDEAYKKAVQALARESQAVVLDPPVPAITGGGR